MRRARSEAVSCRHGSVVKSLARGLDRPLDVFSVAFRDLREHFAGGGIVSRKSFSGSGVDPLAVDQHFAGFIEEFGNLWVNLGGKCDTHTTSFVKTEINPTWLEDEQKYRSDRQ